jgi:hypothetical protein
MCVCYYACVCVTYCDFIYVYVYVVFSYCMLCTYACPSCWFFCFALAFPSLGLTRKLEMESREDEARMWSILAILRFPDADAFYNQGVLLNKMCCACIQIHWASLIMAPHVHVLKGSDDVRMIPSKFLKVLNWGATRSNLVVPPLWSFRLWKHPKLRYLDVVDVVDVVTLMTWPGFDTYRGIYRGQDAAQRRKSVSAWTNLHKACETMRTLSPTL